MHARWRVLGALRRVIVDFPLWMVERLDREAKRLGVRGQSVIKLWIAEKLDSKAP